MDPQKRRTYSEDYRAEAIAMTLKPGATVAGVARDLGIGESLLHPWLRKARGRTERATLRANETEHEEVVRLRRELARVTSERDFLKKVSAFFAKDAR